MEPYIIISLLVILAGGLCLMAKVRRLERENRHLRIQCNILSEISKSIFAVSDRLIHAECKFHGMNPSCLAVE